jgi:tRNA-Thr(GGU) m(6)t(6)A37 methyltransferase TsaA
VVEAAPDFCPMRGEFPEFEDLYPEGGTRDLLTRAALVEAGGYCRWTRLREIAEFARLMEFERVGLPHCPDMASEARRAASFLREEGLDTFLPPASSMGDPEVQAQALAQAGVDFNVLSGMCVAHEAIFLQATGTPTVSLVSRDVRLRNNPAAGLYTSRSYLKSELFGYWPADERTPFRGGSPEILHQVAEEVYSDEGPPVSRISEAMSVAHALGAGHIGISFCVGFREEAKILARILQANGFEVSSVCCKTGSVPKEEAGIRDDQKVRPGTAEMICNPVAQAELLNRDEIQFALILGQCVGHDAATLMHLDVPAACIVTKDRVLAHNTTAALPPEPAILRPIGVVENGLPLGTPSDTLRKAESKVVVDSSLVAGLQDLNKEDRILVVFHFHLSTGWDPLQHPKGDESRPRRGVFALRSPRRPNGIGVTEVDLLEIRDNILTVRGLDAVDGTPVLDLKPA